MFHLRDGVVLDSQHLWSLSLFVCPARLPSAALWLVVEWPIDSHTECSSVRSAGRTDGLGAAEHFVTRNDWPSCRTLLLFIFWLFKIHCKIYLVHFLFSELVMVSGATDHFFLYWKSLEPVLFIVYKVVALGLWLSNLNLCIYLPVTDRFVAFF